MRFFICLIAALSWSACGNSDVPAPTRAAANRIASGRAHYQRYCALCHGEYGEGYRADHANALSNKDFLTVATDEFLIASIARGRPGTPMSAWSHRYGGPLDENGILDVVAFLRSLGPRAEDLSHIVVQGDPSRGLAVYAERCVSCHGPEGRGASAVSLSNPRFLEAASDGYLRWTIQRGRRGTPMQAFAGVLPRQAINDLVALIRSWTRTPNAPTARPPTPEPPPLPAEIVIHPQGAVPEFDLREERFVAADAVKAAIDRGARIVLVDARAHSDYLTSHITGAINVPFYAVESLLAQIDLRDTWIVAYCACPHAASGHVVDELRSRGHKLNAVLDEGVGYWEQKGYPMTRAPEALHP